MKERILFQNQAQMGSRGESAPIKSKLIPIQSGLTPKANPYKLEWRMSNDQGEAPKPSIGEQSRTGPERGQNNPDLRPPGQALTPQEYKEQAIRDLADLVGIAREKGVGVEGIQALQALFQEGANQREMEQALLDAGGDTDDSRISEIRGRIEGERLGNVEVSNIMPGFEEPEDETEEVGSQGTSRDKRINLGGVEDAEIKGLVEDWNRRILKGAVPNPIEEMDRIALEVSKRYRSGTFTPEESLRIQQLTGRIEAGVARELENMSERELAARRERLQRTNPKHYFYPEDLEAMASDKAEDKDKREKIFNDIFKRADFNPTQQFDKVFSSFYDEPVYTAFIDLLQNYGKDTEANKFILERQLRENAHNANYVVLQNIGSKDFIGFAQQLTDGQVDYAFRLKGVTKAMHAFEQAFLKVREENGGFIPPEDVSEDPKSGERGKVEKLARRYLIKEIRAGLLEVEEKDKDGKVVMGGIPHDVDENDWRINRAIAVARGMGLLTGRVIEIAASSIVPEGNRYISLYAQKIIGDLAPFRHLVGKFDITRKGQKNRLFAFFLKRNKLKPWEYSELKEMTDESILRAANGLAEPGKKRRDRLISQLNPFKSGGAFSGSTWRTAEDDIEAGATGDMKARGQGDRMGTGVIIEKNKKYMAPDSDPKKKEAAKEEIEKQLNIIQDTQPLKLFFNMRGTSDKNGENPVGLQGQVLREMDDYKFDNEALERYVKAQAGTLGKDESGLTNEDKKKLRDKEDEIRVEERKKIKYYPKLVGDIENPELVGDIDELVILQEKYLFDVKKARDAKARGEVISEEDDPEGKGLNFASITDKDTRDRVEKLASKIKEKFKNGRDDEGRTHREGFLEDLADKPWRQPFNFGTDDVPYDEYQFIKLGSNAIARRWGDFGQENEAVAATLELMNNIQNIKTPEQAAQALYKIYIPVERYDGEHAKDVVGVFAEGIAKFNSKNYVSRLPGGLGMMLGVIKGKNSFAEYIGGRGAASWDENDVNKFYRILRTQLMISPEKQKELQGKTIGGKVDVGKAFLRNYLSLGIIALLMYIMRSSITHRDK